LSAVSADTLHPTVEPPNPMADTLNPKPQEEEEEEEGPFQRRGRVE